MVYSLRWTPEAKEDLVRLHDFLDAKNPQAAWRVLEAIQQASFVLKSHPEMGVRVHEASKERQLIIPFAKTSYVLRYRMDGAQYIVILRVWNSREDWQYKDET